MNRRNGKRGSGWYGDIPQHRLASYGVKTTTQKFHKQEEKVPPKELSSFDWFSDNLDKIIHLFWWSSYHDKWEWFNFGKAFGVVKEMLYHKLGTHFSLPDDEQVEYSKNQLPFYEIYSRFLSLLSGFGNYDEKVVKMYEDRTGNEITIDLLDNREKVEDIPKLKDIIIETTVKNVDYLGTTDLPHYYNEIKNINLRSAKLEEKINLFDELIHIEHQTQSLSEDYVGKTIPKLRNQFEEEYL